jgi:hypothetical protein
VTKEGITLALHVAVVGFLLVVGFWLIVVEGLAPYGIVFGD